MSILPPTPSCVRIDTGRRRRWTDEEKLRIVEESLSAPQRKQCFIGTLMGQQRALA